MYHLNAFLSWNIVYELEQNLCCVNKSEIPQISNNRDENTDNNAKAMTIT